MGKNYFIIALLLLLATAAFAKSYSIPEARVDYYLQENGDVQVTQSITYSLSGSFGELYIQLPTDLRIESAGGYCEERQSCVFRTQINEGWRELVLADNYQGGKVATVFKYTLKGEVLAQKDTAQFFYKLWGDQWDKPVGKLTASVHMPPGAQYTDYYVHPPMGDYEVADRKSSLSIVSINHPANTYLEANLLFPKSGLQQLPNAGNYMSAQEIRDGEMKYADSERQKKEMQAYAIWLYIAAALVIPLAFAALYLKFGTEKPLSYQGIYEREPPSDLTPAEAAYLLERQQAPSAWSGEILWLAYKGYLKSEERKGRNKVLFIDIEDKSFYLTLLKKQGEYASLKPHQARLMDFLWGISNNGEVKVTEMPKRQSQFFSAYTDFFKTIQDDFNRRFMDNRGNAYMGIAIGASVIAMFCLLFIMPSPDAGLAVLLEFAMAFVFGILVGAKPEILGRWTEEGRVQEKKWAAFKKYMQDFGLLKEKTVPDLILWDYYLVYATAFGISKEVLKALASRVPESEMKRHPGIHTHAALGAALYSSAARGASSSSGGHSSGGFGGGMGGGGGGGGAR